MRSMSQCFSMVRPCWQRRTNSRNSLDQRGGARVETVKVQEVKGVVQCAGFQSLHVHQWDGPAVLRPCERAKLARGAKDEEHVEAFLSSERRIPAVAPRFRAGHQGVYARLRRAMAVHD